jgi:hypothetical protein
LRLFTILIVFIFVNICSFAQVGHFLGKPGFYILGSANIPMIEKNFEKIIVDGAAVRVRWEDLETSPSKYDWSFIDGEIKNAKKYSKHISISILGSPQWIKDSLGAATFNYIEENTNHSTNGDTLFGFIPWDKTYIDRVNKLIQKLGSKYSQEATISYFNTISTFFSRNLPDTLFDKTLFYQVYSYNPDTLVRVMKAALDVYMENFPNTSLWSSMDYIRFEPAATGKPINYVASEYAKYGVEKYPDRFGVWREDLSACNPQANIPVTSHWYIIAQNPEGMALRCSGVFRMVLRG